MKEINLREFYPWYMEDVMVEVTEEVAEELLAGQRYIKPAAAVSIAIRHTTGIHSLCRAGICCLRFSFFCTL